MSGETDRLFAVARAAPMTWEEAESIAIERGALQPKGFKEGLAANLIEAGGGRWRDTPLAQGRLGASTHQIYHEANSGSGDR
jgi:hypothetical protein